MSNSASRVFRATAAASCSGLEFLGAADIGGTAAATPSFESLGILGLIIAFARC